jgi:hypothetical protein
MHVLLLLLAFAGPAQLQPLHLKCNLTHNICCCGCQPPFPSLLQDLLIFSLNGLGGWAHLATHWHKHESQIIPTHINLLWLPLSLQDLLIFSLKGLGGWAHLASQNGVEVPQEIQSFITGATFSTLTNGELNQHYCI